MFGSQIHALPDTNKAQYIHSVSSVSEPLQHQEALCLILVISVAVFHFLGKLMFLAKEDTTNFGPRFQFIVHIVMTIFEAGYTPPHIFHTDLVFWWPSSLDQQELELLQHLGWSVPF